MCNGEDERCQRRGGFESKSHWRPEPQGCGRFRFPVPAAWASDVDSLLDIHITPLSCFGMLKLLTLSLDALAEKIADDIKNGS